MKVSVIETKAFNVNPYEIRVNAMIRYCNKAYAVSCVTTRSVNANYQYTIYTKSINYISSIARASKIRDRAIIQALNNTVFTDLN